MAARQAQSREDLPLPAGLPATRGPSKAARQARRSAKGIDVNMLSEKNAEKEGITPEKGIAIPSLVLHGGLPRRNRR